MMTLARSGDVSWLGRELNSTVVVRPRVFLDFFHKINILSLHFTSGSIGTFDSIYLHLTAFNSRGYFCLSL